MERTGQHVVEPEVLNFGPGALGLGLIGPRAIGAGFRFHLAGRRTGSRELVSHQLDQNRAYRATDGTEVVDYPVDGFYFYEEPEGSDAAAKFIEEAPSLIITTTARAGQPKVASFLRDCLERRFAAGNDGLIALAPCENNVAPQMLRLHREFLESGLIMLHSMVDRICERPEISTGDFVEVRTERPSEWVVEIDAPTAAGVSGERLGAYLDRMGVQLVSDIEPDRERKRLMMNGPQMCLALFARVSGYKRLGEFLATERGTQALAGLLNEYGMDLQYRQAEMLDGELREVQDWYGRRLANFDDDIARLLAQLEAGNAGPPLLDAQKRLMETHDNLLTIFDGDRDRLRGTWVHQAALIFREIWGQILD